MCVSDNSHCPQLTIQRSQPNLPVSGVVICQDEEDSIAACLVSLSFCREIIVVDSGSSDATIGIIQRLKQEGLPIKLIHQAWLGYASQKQFALSAATQCWCLVLDADERLDDDLQRNMGALITLRDDVAGWMLRRLPFDMSDCKPHFGNVVAKPILRLVRRDRARFDERVLVHEGLLVSGTVRTSPWGLIHHERKLQFIDLVRKQLGYAALKGRERVLDDRTPSILRLLFNPMLYFIRLFFLHRWFLCGKTGMFHAAAAALYAFAAEAVHFDLQKPARKVLPWNSRHCRDGVGQ